LSWIKPYVPVIIRAIKRLTNLKWREGGKKECADMGYGRCRAALIPASQTSQYSDATPFKKDGAAEAEDNPTNKRHHAAGRVAPDDGEKKDRDHRGTDEGSAFDCVGLDEGPNAEQESEPDAYGLVWNAQENNPKKNRERKGGSGGWI